MRKVVYASSPAAEVRLGCSRSRWMRMVGNSDGSWLLPVIAISRS